MGLLMENETFKPFIFTARIPRTVRAITASLLRVALERLVLISEARRCSIWRSDFINTAQQQPERQQTVPHDHAAEQAATQERQRNTAGAAFERRLALYTEQGWATQVPPTMFRWRIILALPPETEQQRRIHVYLQPPAAVRNNLTLLWNAGFRVDGFAWGDIALTTIIDEPQQMLSVRSMISWINNYCAVAPVVGIPPAPWTLTASRSLVEQISRFDSHSAN